MQYGILIWIGSWGGGGGGYTSVKVVGSETYCSWSPETGHATDYPQQEEEGSTSETTPDDYQFTIDCHEDVDGTAEWIESCKTCIGGNTGVTECPPLDTLNKTLDTCLRKAIKMALDSGVKNDFKQIMDSTFLRNHNIVLTFEEANINDTTLMGEFTPWRTVVKDGYTYQQGTITFNTETIPGASQEMAVWTLYHEVLHAYLGRIGALMPNSYNHQYMATTFVNKMSSALQKLFPDMSNSDSIAMGWAGLKGTPMWELKTQNQQYDYILIINKSMSFS